MAFTSLFEVIAALPYEQATGVSVALAKLNEAQRAAVVLPMTVHAVILAGAGTGKTTTLVERAAWLVEQGVPPSEILLSTFTKAAAEEMKQRLRTRLGARCPEAIGTLHALALSLAGGFVKLGVTLITDDQLMGLLDELSVGDPAVEGLTSREVLLQIGRLREERVVHHPLYALTCQLKAKVEALGMIDFTGLLELAATRELPTFRHILVDEAQDLTAAQLSLIARISRADTRRYYVGDDDQSIYQFRGAFAGALGGLMHEGATKLCLTENYRCGSRILEIANTLIHYNVGRFEKSLVPASGREGEVVFAQCADIVAERNLVDRWRNMALAANKKLTVLSRTRALLEPYAEMDGVRTASLHESKGLEWDWVILLGLEENQLPHRMSADIHEERRLAYVGITRARERLALVSTSKRVQRQKRSRFWDECLTPAPDPVSLVAETPLW